MSFKEFTKELNGNRVEGELVKTALYSLITSFLVLGIAYYFKLRNISGYNAKYGFFLLFAALSYALVVPTIRQVRAYNKFNCMSGMMIGMTVGMIAGFLSGYIIGATNGMFTGGVFGMLVGIILGIWVGSCCGVMGFMEGIMAGLMGGWMGAMTAVMLINDHLRLATGIIFVVCAVILVSLNYMVYVEAKDNDRHLKEDHFTTFFITLILIIITIGLTIFGPKGLI